MCRLESAASVSADNSIIIAESNASTFSTNKNSNSINMKSNKILPKPSLYTLIEAKMLASVVTIIECAVLLFATTKALMSIVNPKVRGAVYYGLVLLPLSLILPAIAVQAVEQDPSSKTNTKVNMD